MKKLKTEKITLMKMEFISDSFFLSANTLADKCLAVENEIGKRDRFQLIIEHNAYFYGVIFCSVSFLESYINEFFTQLVNGDLHDEVINQHSLDLICKLWKMDVPSANSYRMLDKYQILLTLCDKPIFSKDQFPYKDADILVQLRNRFVHYKPEYIESSFKNPRAQKHKIEEQLKGKFTLNPFASKLDSFYPLGIISYSCCQWALDSTTAFINEFNRRVFPE